MSLWIGIQRGMSRRIGMNGTSARSDVRPIIRMMTRRSVFVGGVEGRDLVPEREEPQPGLARILAGLVHHSPLVAGEVLVGGKAGQVRAVAHEEQRLGEVGLVEVAAAGQQAVERAGPGEVEQAGHQIRHRAVVAGGNGDLVVGDRRIRQRPSCSWSASLLLVRGGRPVRVQRRVRVGLPTAAKPSGLRTKSWAVSIGMPTPAHCLRRDRPDRLARVRRVVVRAVRIGPCRSCTTARTRGGHEVDRVLGGPCLDRDGRIVRRREDARRGRRRSAIRPRARGRTP
jgi:hypothetical protein